MASLLLAGSHYCWRLRVQEKSRAGQIEEAGVEERAAIRVAVGEVPEKRRSPREVEESVLAVVDGGPGARPQLLEPRVSRDVDLSEVRCRSPRPCLRRRRR